MRPANCNAEEPGSEETWQTTSQDIKGAISLSQHLHSQEYHSTNTNNQLTNLHFCPKDLNMSSTHNTLGNDEWLLTGNSLWSESGVYELRMQEDGKIVVYENGNPTWQNTKQQRDDVKGLRMQADGNLVI